MSTESFQTAEKIPDGIDLERAVDWAAAAIEARLRLYPTLDLLSAGWGATPRELAMAAVDAIRKESGSG